MPHTRFVLPGARSWVTEVPPPKRRRLLTTAVATAATESDSSENESGDTLNLVYPFWWTGLPSGSGSGTGITVNPEGPLVLEDGVLSVQLYNPIVLDSGAIRLAFDSNTLALSNQEGKLMVKTSAPLVKGIGGGITLNYDPSMFGLNSITGSLQILLSPNGNPIINSTSGLTLNYDTTTLGLSNDGALQLLINNSGPLATSSQGLTINVDPAYFTVNDGQLSFKVPAYVSPYAIFEVASTNWRTYSGIVRSVTSADWNVSYRCLIVNSGGLCNGIINIALPRTSVATTPTPVAFTFVLALSVGQSSVGSSNLSNINTPTITPAGGNQYFYPSIDQEVGSYLGVNPNGNWYIPSSTPGMSLVTFNPSALGVTTFSAGTCGYSQGTIEVLDGGVPPPVMVFAYSVPIYNGNWGSSNTSATSNDVLITGPLSFSYQGATYTAAQWTQA
ncbi:fiber 1 [Psittacine adenovirus 1]|uniref:Fiber 1 n=1 Tax=Psittacine adenovirus 1 TaxID=318592 RepID=A0A2Z5E040_9ADEN|nr:fiber 1 [Psittacine adenovirus 1]AXB73027.1 fiber 1 [Psittacine adenovirus 1]